MKSENDGPDSEKSEREHNFSCLKMAIPRPNGSGEYKKMRWKQNINTMLANHTNFQTS